MIIENYHTLPKENFFKELVSLNWNFQDVREGGGGSNPKNPPWEDYGFLQQRIGLLWGLIKIV